LEEKLYLDEGIEFEDIKFEDNSEFLALIENKPQGILYMLYDEMIYPESSDEKLLN